MIVPLTSSLGRSSNHSTGTRADSGFSSTLDSSSTAFLDRRRHLSPVVHTPTSSTASPGDTSGLSPRSTPSRQYGRPIAPRRIRHDYVPGQRESLLGIDQTEWNPKQLRTFQNQEFVSARGPGPAKAQLRPQSWHPWSSQQLRYQPHGPSHMTSNEPSCSHHDSPPGGCSQRSRRTGPLKKEQADKASIMRTIGSCIRCRIYKESCVPGEPCGSCRDKKKRKWRLGCIRIAEEGFERRWEVMFPDFLFEALDWKNVYSFINRNASNYKDQQVFHLRLTQEIGPALSIHVKEADPLGEALLRRSAFVQPAESTGTALQRIELISPPILPYYADAGQGCDDVRGQLGQWLNDVTNDQSVEWHLHCFPREEEGWQAEVLAVIGAYYHSASSKNKPLRLALQVMYLNHIMIHPFVIPDTDVQELFARLNYDRPGPEDEVSPRGVQKFISMLVLPELKKAVKNTLETLQDYHEKMETSREARDLAFCLTFLLLIVLGKLQVSAAELAELARQKVDAAITFDEARNRIRSMEVHLGENLIGLWYYKAVRPSKRRPSFEHDEEVESYAKDFRLFEKLQQVEVETDEKFTGPTELEHVDESTFHAMNTARLLRRFYGAVLMLREQRPEWLS